MLLDDPQPIKPFPIGGCIVVAGAVILVVVMLRVLIPLGPGGNDSSKAQVCAGNLHNLSAAFAEYAQDYDGLYPHGVETAASGVGWAGLVWPYVRNPASYQCPSELRGAGAGKTVISYGYNSNISHHPAESGDASPSRTILLFEVSGADARINSRRMTAQIDGTRNGKDRYSPSGNGIDGMLLDGTDASFTVCQYATGLVGGRESPGDYAQFDGDAGRHVGAANYAMADGHAALIAGAHVSSGITALEPEDPQTGSAEGRAAGSNNAKFTATFSAR